MLRVPAELSMASSLIHRTTLLNLLLVLARRISLAVMRQTMARHHRRHPVIICKLLGPSETRPQVNPRLLTTLL
jgi:hypothetical protein